MEGREGEGLAFLFGKFEKEQEKLRSDRRLERNVD